MIEYSARADALRSAVLEHALLTSGAFVLAAGTVVLLYPWRATRSTFEQIAVGLKVCRP